MVQILIGRKGSGKTKAMCDMANTLEETVKGSIVFLSKNDRLIHDLKYRIRVVCMEDFQHITNADEYIGFIYGIISSDNDLEYIFIDSILKHADIEIASLPAFLDRLDKISELYGPKFVVSLSADKEELSNLDFSKFEVLNA